MKQIDGGITAVPGLKATGVHAGLKPDNENDVALIAADAPAVAAGVFTKNRVCAPVVLVCRENLSDNTGQAIIINSKNANACTGEVGMKNARQMASLVGETLGIDPSLVLVASTGVSDSSCRWIKLLTASVSLRRLWTQMVDMTLPLQS